MQEMEVGVGRKGAAQELSGVVVLPQGTMNHPRVKEELGIPGAKLEGLGHRRQSLSGLAGFEQGPREGVIAVDVLSHLELRPGQAHGLVELHLVIGVKGSQLAVVHHAIDRIEAPDVLDKGVLLSCFVGSSELGVEVAEPHSVLGERDDPERLSVQVRGVLVALLRGADLRETRESPVVFRVGLEGFAELGLCGLKMADGEVLDTKLPLCPREALGRLACDSPSLDGASQSGDGTLWITLKSLQP